MLTFEDSVIAEITFDFLCVMLYTHIDKGVTLKKKRERRDKLEFGSYGTTCEKEAS